MSNLIDDDLLDELKALMEDDFTSLLDRFLADSEMHCRQAQSAWEDGNLAEVRIYAHSMRGSSGNLGAVKLQGACADLEELARTGQGQEVGAQLLVVKEELQNTSQVLRRYL